MVAPVFGIMEHLRRMYVADDMVNVALIDYNLTVSALYELLLQLVEGAVIGVDGIDFRTRYHTVADLCIGEVEGILKNLYLIVDVVVVLGVVDARLHEIVEVDLRKRSFLLLSRYLHAEEAEHASRQPCGYDADRPQQDIEDEGQWCKQRQQLVRIALEKCLGKELAVKRTTRVELSVSMMTSEASFVMPIWRHSWSKICEKRIP